MKNCALSEPIQISSGQVKGCRREGIIEYLGVPYAQPPVRFELPQPREPWPGIFEATERGPAAPHRVGQVPQIDAEALVGSGSDGGDGDYLRANIWAPEDAANAPVMVWIHGGGYVVGSKDAPVSDGTAFAQSGVVCIAINYRMGIDGFLPVPGVPTNLGLRDMLFALNWVQANASAFGGDPKNVTVFGESAGGMAIANLMSSPMAKGLFHRAVIQSGHDAMVREISVAQRLVRKMARALGVTPDAEGFRDVSFEAGWKAIEKLGKPWGIDLRDAEGHEPVFGISRFIPVWGDDVLPKKPIDALRDGAGAEIDVLIGTCAEEMNLYFVPTKVRSKIPGFLARLLLSRSNPQSRDVLAAYGLAAPGVKPGEAMTRAMSDLVFRWPARQFAHAHSGRTWFYEMDWKSTACGGELGACHAIDVPFVFKTLECSSGPRGFAGEAPPPQDFAERVHSIWTGFAKGDRLPWREWDARQPVYQLYEGEVIEEPRMRAADFLPN